MKKRIFSESEDPCPRCGHFLDYVEEEHPEERDDNDLPGMDVYYECLNCDAQWDMWMQPRW